VPGKKKKKISLEEGRSKPAQRRVPTSRKGPRLWKLMEKLRAKKDPGRREEVCGGADAKGGGTAADRKK